jgi:hypothetical protein
LQHVIHFSLVWSPIWHACRASAKTKSSKNHGKSQGFAVQRRRREKPSCRVSQDKFHDKSPAETLKFPAKPGPRTPKMSSNFPLAEIGDEWRWGRDFFRAERSLRAYGGAAKEVLPRLKRETRAIAEKEGKKQLESLDQLIDTIEVDKDPKPVRSTREFLHHPTQP